MKPTARWWRLFHFETSVAKERVLWFDALVGDTSSEVSGRCNGGRKASQQKCSQAGHSWQPMDMKNCRPQLNGTFSSADCLDSVRNWFVTKNDNSLASSRPNAKNISLVDFDNFCIDVADTIQPLVWNGTPLQGFSESPATTQVSLFESYFNEGDHQTLLGLREIDNIVKPNCGNTSPPPPPPPPPSGSCGGHMDTTWDFSNHPDTQPTLTLPITDFNGLSYNATIDWGDGTTSVISSFN